MNWNDEPVEPVTPSPPQRAVGQAPGGIRRGVLTAAIAGLLLVGGGVAAVSAASPDPSASPAPAATSDPSGGTDRGGNGTAPNRAKGDCPDDGSGSGGSDGTTPDASPDTSPDASPDGGTSSSGA